MAKVAVEALRSSGSPSRYIIDSSNELLYPHTSGASDAFAIHQIGIKYSYTIELRDTGTHGFLLPSSYIESSAQEAFEIIKGMIDYI
jgi:carboxypeptidase B2